MRSLRLLVRQIRWEQKMFWRNPAAAVFTFVFAWNDFIFALVMTRSAVTTFPVQVTHYFGAQSNFWAKIAAMSVLGTVPIFIAVALLQRFLVRGISLGAVKG